MGFGSFNRLERRAVEHARHWLDRVKLTARADEAAGDLPYGEQRRLEIARAMCTRPLLLCLDEPAAGLNARESEGLNELLYSIRDEEGIALLLIEHDMSVVMRISDHIVVLDYGKKIADGTADEVRSDPPSSPPISACPTRSSTRSHRRSADERAPAQRARRRACYGELHALHGVTSIFTRGEIVALIGANGAGKTTLMMTIFGRAARAHGKIMFDGTDITALPTHVIAKLGIAQSPEGRRIFPRMTVLENLQMGASSPTTQTLRRGPRQGLHPVPGAEGAARSARRHAVGRRAADAGDCAGADGHGRSCCCSTSRRSVSRP